MFQFFWEDSSSFNGNMKKTASFKRFELNNSNVQFQNHRNDARLAQNLQCA